MTKKQKIFLIIAASASFLGAVTTALLIFLTHPVAIDFESAVQLHNNSLYMARLWILFLHPQFNIIASLGIAFLLFREYPLQIILGTFFLLVWAFTEMSQQALLIDALNLIWRPGYLTAATPEDEKMFRTMLETANGISDSKYFLVIYGFGIGSLLFGLAFIHLDKLGKWIGWALLFIGVLSLSSFLRYYAGFDFLNPIVDWLYQYIYSYLQPLVRIGIGLWIIGMTNKNLKNQITI